MSFSLTAPVACRPAALENGVGRQYLGWKAKVTRMSGLRKYVAASWNMSRYKNLECRTNVGKMTNHMQIL